MHRFITVAAGAASLASVEGQKYAPQQQAYGGGYRGNGYRPQVSFPPAYQIIDPSYSGTIFTRYQSCLSTKCGALPSAYNSTSLDDCIGTIGAYTSCVTACASAEALLTVTDFKTLLQDVLAVGAHQLKTVRKYLSGQDEEFDPIAQRIHIGDSCCLPIDYFTEWSRIMVPVTNKLKIVDVEYVDPETKKPQPEPAYDDFGGEYGYGNNGGYDGQEYYDDAYGNDEVGGYDGSGKSYDAALLESENEYRYGYGYQKVRKEIVAGDLNDNVPFLISASEYLAICTNRVKSFNPNPKVWTDYIECKGALTSYLHFLQANVGHLILAPECVDRAPDGSCCNTAQKNPRAVPLNSDVCIAYEAKVNDKVETLSIPLVKKPLLSGNSYDSCPPDATHRDGADGSNEGTKIYYQRVQQRNLKLFTVTDGLPSAPAEDENTACNYKLGLINLDTWKLNGISDDDITAAKKCPDEGLFEYCNMEQYAGFLQKQLFDHSGCAIADLRGQHSDESNNYQTVACLYKIFSLKCDCMEAVFNCYTHTSKYNNALSKTIGQAASILCGFILCQQPAIYSLFGDQYAIDHAILIKEFLQTAGLMTSDATPALTMLVSFGLGMVALIAVKKATAQKQIKIEHGYDNLI